MNERKQHGFSAALVVVLVVGVLAAGFVAWRIYDASKQPKTDGQGQQTSQQGTQQTQTDPNASYIVIKEWGVRFKPANGLTDATYTTDDTANPPQARFSTTALAQYGETCGTGAASRSPLGMLTRTTATKDEFASESGAFVKHIGNYYYQYVTPQTACADGSTAANTLQTQMTALFKPSIATLEAAR